jgi:hypothetical protein
MSMVNEQIIVRIWFSDKPTACDKTTNGELADSIQNEWCSLLEKEDQLVISRESLSTAVTEILDTNPRQIPKLPHITEKPKDLYMRYEHVMTSLFEPPV